MNDQQRRVSARYYRAVADLLETYPDIGFSKRADMDEQSAAIIGGDVLEGGRLALRVSGYVTKFTETDPAQMPDLIRAHADALEARTDG